MKASSPLPGKLAAAKDREGIPMLRWFIFLPLCLFLQDWRWSGDQDLRTGEVSQVVINNEPLAGPALMRQELLASLASSNLQTFPGNLPWVAVRQVSLRREQMIEEILHDQPKGALKFLQMSLERYDHEVQGYSCILTKRERVKGKLKEKPEVTQCYFKEKPFSVYMNWIANPGDAQRILYVEGEYNNKMMTRPSGLKGLIGVLAFDPDAPLAKNAGRYLVTEFGIKIGTKRTLNGMKLANDRGALFVSYEGIYRVPECGDRLCHKLVRKPCTPLEDEGIYDMTFYFDMETWLQVGSILKGPNEELIAEYFFRDVRINPKFKDKQFKKESL
jgi:Protein of unknown function (DUF1571)